MKGRHLRAGRLREFGRGKGDDRHRSDGDPGDRKPRHASPGQGTIRTGCANRADDRVDIAQPDHRLANRRILGHTGFPELGHAVLEVVLELGDEAPAREAPAAQRARHAGQELGSRIAANREPPPGRAQTPRRSRD